MGPTSAQQVMDRKHYARAMRAHKLIYQALWRILLPELLNFIEVHDPDVYADIQQATSADSEVLVTLLASDRFCVQMN